MAVFYTQMALPDTFSIQVDKYTTEVIKYAGKHNCNRNKHAYVTLNNLDKSDYIVWIGCVIAFVYIWKFYNNSLDDFHTLFLNIFRNNTGNFCLSNK